MQIPKFLFLRLEEGWLGDSLTDLLGPSLRPHEVKNKGFWGSGVQGCPVLFQVRAGSKPERLGYKDLETLALAAGL